MTAKAIGALRADRDALLQLGTGLTEAGWAAASGWPARASRSPRSARTPPRWCAGSPSGGDWEQLGVKPCGDERQLGLVAQLKVF
jgi:hypothetical protein